MPRVSFFWKSLFSPTGLPSQYQRPLQALFRELSVVRNTLLPVFRDQRHVPRSASAPRLADFPQLANFREILRELDTLPTPPVGMFDGLVVTPADYARQASMRWIDKTGVKELNLEQSLDLLLKSAPKLNTGSNNTFDGAMTNAELFRSTMGFDGLLHQYLAMDMSWWPSSSQTILSLIPKNIAMESAVIPIQGIVNEAARSNPGLSIAVDSSHSYAQVGRSIALNLFESREIINVRSAFFAPLGRPEAMTGLLLAKNNFSGEVSIIRPGFDPLEEAATSLGEISNNGIFDLLTTDVRLPIGRHELIDISKALKTQLDAKKTTFTEFIDTNYSSRPGSVIYSTDSTGEPERVITTRSGETYSNEAWLAQYNKQLDQYSSNLNDMLIQQTKQLEELIKITGPTVELESVATSIRNMSQSLRDPTTDLYGAVTSVSAQMPSVSEHLSAITLSSRSKMSQAQQETIDDILKSQAEVQKQIEETSDSIEEMSDGRYEPEE